MDVVIFVTDIDVNLTFGLHV